ncbi:MAG: tRNA (guanosine(37)-N1)-methyltransferase TrmD [Verrucomicrobia bacterium]|nr:tRNA (guanosine(37)-N1)-methyltransferase TrmD [Verrucomicrobiota bacterium]
MKFDILTIFPGMFRGPMEESILKRAQEKKLVEIAVHDLRKWTRDKHNTTDDRPFGGGPGMLMKPEPIFEAVEDLKRNAPEARVVLLTPQGRKFDQQVAQELAQQKHLVLVCGHYEGVDERVRVALVNDEISIGDYVLTNGALAAIVVVDAVARLVPGVLGHADSAKDESFTGGGLEYPQYTRPAEFRGMKVPEVLVSGDHAAIARWRAEQGRQRTRERRPDLLKGNKEQ